MDEWTKPDVRITSGVVGSQRVQVRLIKDLPGPDLCYLNISTMRVRIQVHNLFTSSFHKHAAGRLRFIRATMKLLNSDAMVLPFVTVVC